MKIKMFTIPNMLTLCNLLSGCAAVVSALWLHNLGWAFAWVVLAAVFDFFDGFVARLLHSSSVIGKELDSLADMVSFGVAPSAVLFNLYVLAGGSPMWGFGVFVVAAFSALRLAKFNIDENQTKQFIGLPTPACALFFVSSGYWVELQDVMLPPALFLCVAVVFALLLIAPLPMFALKFSHYRFQGNEVRYLFLLLSLGLLIVWHLAALPWIIVLYILISGALYLREVRGRK
ncbi:MAG: CDP-diacylglycerol--serine O-phosphatidyltransferase [Alistipes sp.]|nr:CDP-diacylglycerol--serine O-phosphatidyltransferase [Alistipes sp.]